VIIPVAALVALLVPIILGGSPARMSRVRLRHTAWLLGALAVQVVIIEVLPGPRAVLEAVHVATYAAAGWFLTVNSRIPGLGLVALGTLSNGLTIALNGGTLPARASALRAAGLDVVNPGFANSGVVERPRLSWLGDILAVPSGWPLANVFSGGDVLVVLGVAVASWRICGTRWTQPWTPPRHCADRSPLAPRLPTAPRHCANRGLFPPRLFDARY
jgi:hypothetical protein